MTNNVCGNVFQNVIPLLTVGGWNGSQYFSNLVMTSINRDMFTTTLLNATDFYGLDGLNFE